MTRKVRDIFFWACVVVFALVGPPLVLYARGYRFDIARKKFVATGGLFIKSDPAGASIYINGAKRGETSGALRDAIAKPGLITNLLPKEYDIRVEKKGYIPWVKKLAIAPRQVTEARFILLFVDHNKPLTPSENPVASGARITQDGKEIIGVFEQNATTSIAAVNAQGARRTLYAARHRTAQKQKPVFTLRDVSPTSRFVLVHERQGTQERLLVLDREKRENTPRIFKLPESVRQSVFFGNDSVLFLTGNNELHAWTLESNLATSVRKNVWGVTVQGDKAYVIAGTPPLAYIYTAAKPPQQHAQIMPVPLATHPDAVIMQIGALNHGRLAMLLIPKKEQEGPVLFMESDGTVKTLHENVRSMHVSQDGKKLLMRTWNELWAYYLEDVLTQPAHHKGDIMLIARFGNTLYDARWHPLNSEYVIYTTSEGLFVTELDNRGSGRATLDLVRNGSIELIGATREGAWFTAQQYLAFLPWEPKQK